MNSQHLQLPYRCFAEYIRSVKFLQNTFLRGAAIFGLISIVLVELLKSRGDFEHLAQLLFIIALTLTTLTYIVRKALFPLQLNSISPNAPLRRKLDMYKAAVLVQLALMEAPALFCIISYLLSSNRILLLLLIFQLYQLFITRVTSGNVTAEVPLTTLEKGLINNPEQVIE